MSNPYKSFKQFVVRFLWNHFRPFWINHLWQGQYGYKIDWNNPQNFSEKMQWLACFGDTSLWSLCADKYRVREFLKQRGLEHLAVPLLGVWNKAQDIDYDALPEKFILKCNHDSGTCIIVDKNKPYDKFQINSYLNETLKKKFGYIHGELYYNKIKPCIIAEEFLEDHSCSFSKSLVDYKMFCFDGKPFCTWACHNRDKHCTYVNVYDIDWNVHPEYSIFTDHYRDGEGRVPKPKSYEQMKEAAAILSKGFPEVRVDFYDVDGKLFFGELTFMAQGGHPDYYSKEFLKLMGDQCVLPNKKKWQIL